jgi:hypothetical protein
MKVDDQLFPDVSKHIFLNEQLPTCGRAKKSVLDGYYSNECNISHSDRS